LHADQAALAVLVPVEARATFALVLPTAAPENARRDEHQAYEKEAAGRTAAACSRHGWGGGPARTRTLRTGGPYWACGRC
jgi:hypothetical protein